MYVLKNSNINLSLEHLGLYNLIIPMRLIHTQIVTLRIDYC